jgi:hypothetical protein
MPLHCGAWRPAKADPQQPACVTQVTEPAQADDDTAVHRQRCRANQEALMKANVGGIDRILRIVIGLVLIALAVTGTVGVWGWIGVVPVATAALGFCPLYTVLGINSCPVKRA